MKNRSDIIGSVFLFLLGIGAIIGAIQLQIGSPTEPQPGFFPFVGGVILLIFSTIIFLQGWLGTSKEQIAFGEIGRPALLLGVMILLVFVLDRLGYVIGYLHRFRINPAHPEREVVAGAHHHKPVPFHRNLYPLRPASGGRPARWTSIPFRSVRQEK